MGLLRKYNRHLLKKGYNGPLDFHTPFELGQVITFNRRNGFVPAGKLTDPFFGMTNFTPSIKNGIATADINFGFETGVKFEAKFQGSAKLPNSALDINDAGFRISFDNEASYLLLTKGTSVNIIENIAQLGDAIISLFKSGEWNRDWLILAQIVKADIATLLISRNSKSAVELKAEGAVSGFSDDLVNADINFSLVSNSSVYTNIIGRQGPFYPLFKLFGVKIRRSRPIGTNFKGINEVDSMSAFTINALNGPNSDFQVTFEEFSMNDRFDVEENEII